MLQNPELSQSFVLLSVLRKQKYRISHKIASYSTLEHQFQIKNQQIIQKQQMIRDSKYYRQEMIRQLEKEFEGLRGKHADSQNLAENRMQALRKNLAEIRNVKSQIRAKTEEEKKVNQQISALSQQTQKLTINIEEQRKNLTEKVKELHIIAQNFKILQKNVCNQSQSIEKVQSDLFYTKSQLNGVYAVVSAMERQIEEEENKLFGLEAENRHLSAIREGNDGNVEDRLKKIEKMKKQLNQIINQESKIAKQLNEIVEQQTETENKKIVKLNKYTQIDTELGILKTEVSSVERQMRFMEHRKQCVNILIKRLLGCGDRLKITNRPKKRTIEKSKEGSEIGSKSRITSEQVGEIESRNFSFYNQQTVLSPNKKEQTWNSEKEVKLNI